MNLYDVNLAMDFNHKRWILGKQKLHSVRFSILTLNYDSIKTICCILTAGYRYVFYMHVKLLANIFCVKIIDITFVFAKSNCKKKTKIQKMFDNKRLKSENFKVVHLDKGVLFIYGTRKRI